MRQLAYQICNIQNLFAGPTMIEFTVCAALDSGAVPDKAEQAVCAPADALGPSFCQLACSLLDRHVCVLLEMLVTHFWSKSARRQLLVARCSQLAAALAGPVVMCVVQTLRCCMPHHSIKPAPL